MGSELIEWHNKLAIESECQPYFLIGTVWTYHNQTEQNLYHIHSRFLFVDS